MDKEDQLPHNEILDVVSTERIQRRGGQVVHAAIRTSSGDLNQVDVPVGSLNLPDPYEDN